ncbi:MAG: hypothetical protein GKR88_12650 [Flavobacteriaceae bacterium]|nr:MAG: hypothetical protein GKR88_12650 [Flavobacteriaceae bacterium]
MNQGVTIAGLSINLNFCSKINSDQINSKFIPKEPVSTIYLGQQPETYIVDIIVYIPALLENLSGMDLGSGLFLNKEKLFF